MPNSTTWVPLPRRGSWWSLSSPCWISIKVSLFACQWSNHHLFQNGLYAVIKSCMLKSTVQCRDGCLGAVLSDGNVRWKYEMLSCSTSCCHVIAAQLSYFNNQVSISAVSLTMISSQQTPRPQHKCIAYLSAALADMIGAVMLNVPAGNLSASGDGSNDIAPEVLAAWQAGMTPAQASTAAGDIWSVGSLLHGYWPQALLCQGLLQTGPRSIFFFFLCWQRGRRSADSCHPALPSSFYPKQRRRGHAACCSREGSCLLIWQSS